MSKDNFPHHAKGKTEYVKAMFNNIAPTYDSLNHILSFSIDKLWRKRVVKIVEKSGARLILDMATGTGDLAIGMANAIQDAKIIGADLSPKMLAVAAKKVANFNLADRITLTETDVNSIKLESESVDCVTVAFGVRNFENIIIGLTELHRIIKRGGTIVILEFSNPQNCIVRWCYKLYSHYILPTIGRLISHDRSAYTYLPTSVDNFATPHQVEQMLSQIGFTDIVRKSQSFGIAQIYIGKK